MKDEDMTLQQLEYIMAVYRYEHFAKAADHCKVTQPTLSSMVQKLETELGVKIFDRRKLPIKPTAAGMVVIEQAQEVLASARRLKEAVSEQRKSLSGTFKLGILPTVAPYLLPRVLRQLMKDYPEVDLRVFEMKTGELRQALLRGDIDAAILAKTEGMEDFSLTHLYYERFFVYVAKNNALYHNKAIRTVDLNDEFLWLLDEGHCFRDQLVKFCQLKAAKRSQQAYKLGSIETFMRIVESGKGVTFIPELALLQLTEEQRELVRPFAYPIPSRDIVLATSPDFIRVSLLRLLTEEITTAVPKEMLQQIKGQQVV